MKRVWKCGCDVICFNSILCVCLWRSCSIPNWVQSGKFAFLLRHMYVGMLAEVYTLKCIRVG